MKIYLWPENGERQKLRERIKAFVLKCEAEGFAKTMLEAWDGGADYYAESNGVPNAIYQSTPYRAAFSSPTSQYVTKFPDNSLMVWQRKPGRNDSKADQFRAVDRENPRERGEDPTGPSWVSPDAEFRRQGITPVTFDTHD